MKQTAVEWLDYQITICFENYDGATLYHRIEDKIEEAKEMEKEQMCSFAEFVATYPDKNTNINGEMLHAKSKYDGAERTIDLLETFKSE